jgi:hypothetical protein
MCNRYDTPYHEIKRELSSKLDEITSIWMVGVKDRQKAVDKGVCAWSDPRCSSDLMEIKGEKIGPTVDAIMSINRNKIEKIKPDIVLNNSYEWQTKSEFDFYIDFEAINSCFYDREINVLDSSGDNGVLFMIGVGYEENNKWVYKSFIMERYTREEEARVIEEFIKFLENRILSKMEKHKIREREYIKPNLFCWGHAERTMFANASKRHGKWSEWQKTINWVDFCKVFISEPIVIKGAKKFNLKEITNAMHQNEMINCHWNEEGVTSGLGAMIEAAKFYRFLEEYHKVDPRSRNILEEKRSQFNKTMKCIEEYNEVDCRAVREIVKYLREKHTQ